MSEEVKKNVDPSPSGKGTTSVREAAGRPFFDGDYESSASDPAGPLKVDSLGARQQVDSFARLIASSDARLPLSIGLFGNWGVGKTHFMNLLIDAVDHYVESGPLNHLGKPVYVRRVAQIRFNAWHFHDTNLWASMAVHIFDSLAVEFSGNQNLQEIEKLRGEIRRSLASSEQRRQAIGEQVERQKEVRQAAVKKLGDLKIVRAEQAWRLDRARFNNLLKVQIDGGTVREVLDGKVAKAAKDLGLDATIRTAEDAGRLAQQFRQLSGGLRSLLAAVNARFSGPAQAAITIGWIALVFGISLAIPRLSEQILGYREGIRGLIADLAGLVAMAVPILTWVGGRLKAASTGLTYVERVRDALTRKEETPEEVAFRKEIEKLDAELAEGRTRLQAAERDMVEAQAQLQHINGGGLVYDFVRGQSTSEAYTSRLGLVSTIRQDLARLRVLLSDWEGNSAGQAPIERIILYIDDLDRCHPDKVVEVLQAVHLLLAFDLFVVVVAVDPRWLERSLYRAYLPELAGRLGTARIRGDNRLVEFSPQNYLEKIFQIPFSLATMAEDGYTRLIDRLTTDVDQRDDSWATGAGLAGDGPSEADDAMLPIYEYEKAFLRAMHPFVATPRLAKRVVNIYRLLRVRAGHPGFDFHDFIAPTGAHRAAIVLLAINMSHARFYTRMVRLLTSPQGAPATWTEFLKGVDPALEASARPAWAKPIQFEESDTIEIRALKQELALVAQALKESALELPDAIGPYKTWAAEVGRFSFHWYLS